MKIIATIITAVFMAVFSQAYALDLEYVRSNYDKAIDNEKLCKELIGELSKQTGDVYLGYLGAFQTIWANHTINPINKLSTFEEGKKNIEKAIKNSPNNVELRFIRYSIQKNCPSFLNYSKNMKGDRKFLLEHKSSISSQTLLSLVNKIL